MGALVKNVIFDWSGTLSDDIMQVYGATMAVFEKMGARRISLEEYRREFELPYMDFYRKYIPNADKETQDRLYLDAIRSAGEPKPFPGARETLEALHAVGCRMALLSSHPQEKIDKEVRDYGFSGFFVQVDGGVYDKRDAINGIMLRCGFDRKETAYVGDMTHDVEAGKKAGITTVAVTWGYQPREKLAGSGPDFISEDFGRLEKILH